MIKHNALAYMILAACLATPALAADRDCSRPSPPNIPDGSKVAEAELVATQQELKEYVAQGEYYLGCLKAAEAKLGEDIDEEQQQKLVAAYNQTVDEMKAASEKFNQSVRAFKSGQ